MTDATTLPRRPPSLVPVQVVFGLFIALRLVMHVWGAPLGDETYYWFWGQHPDLSYYDHPPLHAWLLGVVSLFGWWPISTRILTWLTLGGTLWLFWCFAKRYAADRAKEVFWLTAVTYLASPLFFAMTLVSYHDHLLIFLCLAAGWFFVTFAEEYEAGLHRWPRLYAGAVCLGLAVLTKYNGVLFGLGIGVFVLLRPGLRPLLRTPQLWTAAAVSVAMQTPVFLWNLQHGFSSYEFHFATRWGGAHAANWWAPAIFLLASVLSLGPFLVWPMLRLLFGRSTAALATPLTLARTTLGIATLILAGVSIFLGAYFYWNIVAFIAAMPLVTTYLGHRLQFWLHAGFGLIAAVLIVFNFAIAPIAPLTGGTDGGSAVNFGWQRVAEETSAELARHPEANLAGTRYSIASQLGFALRRAHITALSVERDQFDYWFDPAAYAGEDFIILGDDNDVDAEAPYLAAHFREVSLLRTIPVELFGVTVFTFRLYFAEDYQP